MVKLGGYYTPFRRRNNNNNSSSAVVVVNHAAHDDESNCSLLTEDMNSIVQQRNSSGEATCEVGSGTSGSTTSSAQRFRQLNCLNTAQHYCATAIQATYAAAGTTSNTTTTTTTTPTLTGPTLSSSSSSTLKSYHHKKLISIDEEFGDFVHEKNNTTKQRSGTCSKHRNKKNKVGSSSKSRSPNSLLLGETPLTGRHHVMHHHDDDIDDDIDATPARIDETTKSRGRSNKGCRPRTTTAAQLCLVDSEQTMDAVMVESQLLNHSGIEDPLDDSYNNSSNLSHQTEEEQERDNYEDVYKSYDVLPQATTEDSYLLASSSQLENASTEAAEGSSSFDSLALANAISDEQHQQDQEQPIAIFSSSWDMNVAKKLAAATASPMTVPTTATSSPSTISKEQVHVISPEDDTARSRAISPPRRQHQDNENNDEYQYSSFPFIAQALHETKEAEKKKKKTVITSPSRGHHAVVTCGSSSDVSTLEGSSTADINSPSRRLDLSLEQPQRAAAAAAADNSIPDATPSVVLGRGGSLQLPPNQQNLDDILEEVIKAKKAEVSIELLESFVGATITDDAQQHSFFPTTPTKNRQEEIVEHHRNLSRTAERTPTREDQDRAFDFDVDNDDAFDFLETPSFPSFPPPPPSMDTNESLLARYAKLEPFLAMNEAIPEGNKRSVKGPIYSAPVNPLAKRTSSETNNNKSRSQHQERKTSRGNSVVTTNATASSTVSSMADLASSVLSMPTTPRRRARNFCKQQQQLQQKKKSLTPKPSYVGRRRIVSSSDATPATNNNNSTRPFFWRSHPADAPVPRRCESTGESPLQSSKLGSRTLTEEDDDDDDTDDDSNLELWELIQVRNVLRQQHQQLIYGRGGGNPTPSHATISSDDVFFNSFPSTTTNASSGSSPDRRSNGGGGEDEEKNGFRDGGASGWPPLLSSTQQPHGNLTHRLGSGGREVTRIEL
uniref:Uncharacterized protein n=1 Tax=Grammatophora oceanica TaxID=210454 RepID=A0A7S1UWJ0_9STRA|mmetsp:Transcript_26795/g.39170  ORF Transcript_26795/g.39170 Transcript_26795/m.39170 type:complete len:951 (+) Transcript_26795:185-3037(+)|eukprot:CAMPEP_0194033690 /NCGR_PEP_ID=MMETSP0009_2-20130614/6274_1 /TAXON_ID=210454 /ORGANISM="Grammatophora oceanica, Strain CCMP 410" /LENGTH=950 /DNA_ID=CAMNT_0038674407 /DNA_START=175 /DNA_END=3030 /DNA_ORIENTATION=-